MGGSDGYHALRMRLEAEIGKLLMPAGDGGARPAQILGQVSIS
jgi:hypothetical protein